MERTTLLSFSPHAILYIPTEGPFNWPQYRTSWPAMESFVTGQSTLRETAQPSRVQARETVLIGRLPFPLVCLPQ